MKNRSGRVVIISRESDERTLDVAMLEAELLKRGLDVRVLSKLLTKEKSIKALGYAGHVAKQEAVILGADVVVLDTYCIPASMIPHRRGTKVVQIWHALSAIKKFGWQTVGREGGSSERVARLMKMHRGYDYVTCASDITAEHFCEAFRVDRNKVAKFGLPRIDYIRSVTAGERQADARKRILTTYPELAKSKDVGKRIILYAPTFRRGKSVDVKSLADAIDRERYELVVKLHPLYRGDAGQAEGVVYDESFSSYDWLSVADVIISDYSSYVIEATLADKPLYIYAYDIEDYAQNTGLNIDFDAEPIAPYVFRDAGSLASALGKDYDTEALRAFRERYIDIDTEDCTGQLAGFIESLIDK